jgi:hypothetical protein
MIQEIGRLRVVLSFGAITGHYPEIRAVLREKAWSILRAGMARQIYCAFSTFPGWKSAEGMMDYESVWQRFPITDFRTLCLTVQCSPIDDGLGDTILNLLPEDLVQEVRERLGVATPSEGDTWLRRQLETRVPCSPLQSFVADCFSDGDLTRGLVMYGDVDADTPMVLVGRGEVHVRLMMHLVASGEAPLLLLTH